MIPFVNLKSQHKPLEAKLIKAFKDTLKESMFILGPEVEEFENNFSEYLKCKYCFGVASGTDALVLALKSLGISEGDEVIIPANTFIATALAVSFLGAKPVFVDIDNDTFNINSRKIRKAITKKTKAILPVHLYGQPANMMEIVKIAKSNGLYIVEDACQAHGAAISKKKVGNFGDIACFSFYPAKNLGCLGDGGAVVTNDKNLAERIRLLRNYGQTQKYYHSLKGFNSRLDTLQAAFLNIKLKSLDKWNSERQEIAIVYDKELAGVGDIEVPKVGKNMIHVYHLYVIRTKMRQELQSFLAKNNIGTQIHYPVPIHLQEAYSELGYEKGDFPLSEQAANEILSLPIYPGFAKKEQREVISKIKLFYKA